MGSLNDLTGRTFSRWHVIKRDTNNGNSGQVMWVCICDCGTKRSVNSNSLILGTSKSCGCFMMDFNTKHGMADTPEYQIWSSMKIRCVDINNTNYNGRGITVCDRWLHSFENFYADMGSRPSNKHSIDRINNDGNYEPTNCKWSNWQEQANNRRNNVLIEVNDELKTKSQIARDNGISINLLYLRMKKGNSLEESISKIARQYKKELFLINGIEKNISEIAKITGIKESTLYYRLIQAKWPIEKALIHK